MAFSKSRSKCYLLSKKFNCDVSYFQPLFLVSNKVFSPRAFISVYFPIAQSLDIAHFFSFEVFHQILANGLHKKSELFFFKTLFCGVNFLLFKKIRFFTIKIWSRSKSFCLCLLQRVYNSITILDNAFRQISGFRKKFSS